MSDELKDTPDSDLPSILPANIVLPQLANIQTSDTLETLRQDDLNQVHTAMKVIHAVWPKVNSISAVCRLADASFKAIKARRDVLGLEYGSKDPNPASRTIIPYD